MNELPMHIKKAAARYQPIEANDLKLYPVLVREYESFLMARPALEVMHQSLPVAMMRVPLLSALYQMDYEAILQGNPTTGLFSRAVLMLALSLRLGEGKTDEERMRAFEIVIDPENPAKLLHLQFSDADGHEHKITPAQFANLRKIIAEQNGVKIESDMANPDIVKAAKDKSSAGNIELDVNMEDWVSAVSALSGVSEDEIDDWPILKFQRKSLSFQRIIDYIICGIGECSGMVSWPKGNPHPHPFFDRVTDNGILTALGGSADGSKPVPPKAATAIRDITQNLS